MLRAVALLTLAAGALIGGNRPLRVCSDPNNLPFSNRARQGFENKIADLIARDLHTTVEYTWWQQRRNYIRNTLKAGRCDVILGLPARAGEVGETSPYYESSYVFVYRKDRGFNISSLNDPSLAHLRIGLHVTDDSYAPPAAALGRRGIRNFNGYSLLGEASEQNPPAKIIDAVVNGDIDVAIVWRRWAGTSRNARRRRWLWFR